MLKRGLSAASHGTNMAASRSLSPSLSPSPSPSYTHGMFVVTAPSWRVRVLEALGVCAVTCAMAVAVVAAEAPPLALPPSNSCFRSLSFSSSFVSSWPVVAAAAFSPVANANSRSRTTRTTMQGGRRLGPSIGISLACPLPALSLATRLSLASGGDEGSKSDKEKAGIPFPSLLAEFFSFSSSSSSSSLSSLSLLSPSRSLLERRSPVPYRPSRNRRDGSDKNDKGNNKKKRASASAAAAAAAETGETDGTTSLKDALYSAADALAGAASVAGDGAKTIASAAAKATSSSSSSSSSSSLGQGKNDKGNVRGAVIRGGYSTIAESASRATGANADNVQMTALQRRPGETPARAVLRALEESDLEPERKRSLLDYELYDPSQEEIEDLLLSSSSSSSSFINAGLDADANFGWTNMGRGGNDGNDGWIGARLLKRGRGSDGRVDSNNDDTNKNDNDAASISTTSAFVAFKDGLYDAYDLFSGKKKTNTKKHKQQGEKSSRRTPGVPIAIGGNVAGGDNGSNESGNRPTAVVRPIDRISASSSFTSSSSSSSSNFRPRSKPNLNSNPNLRYVDPSILSNLSSPDPIARAKASYAIRAATIRRKRREQSIKRAANAERIKDVAYEIGDAVISGAETAVRFLAESKNVPSKVASTTAQVATAVWETPTVVVGRASETARNVKAATDEGKKVVTTVTNNVRNVPSVVKAKVDNANKAVSNAVKAIENAKTGLVESVSDVADAVYDAEAAIGLVPPRPKPPSVPPPPPPPPPPTAEEMAKAAALAIAGGAAKAAWWTVGEAFRIGGTGVRKMFNETVDASPLDAKVSNRRVDKNGGDIGAGGGGGSEEKERGGVVNVNAAKAAEDAVSAVLSELSDLDEELGKEVADALRLADESLSGAKESGGNSGGGSGISAAAASAADAVGGDTKAKKPNRFLFFTDERSGVGGSGGGAAPSSSSSSSGNMTERQKAINDAVRRAREAADRAARDAADLERMLTQDDDEEGNGNGK